MSLLIKTLDYVLSRMSILIMSLLVLTVSLQVFMRYVIGSPVTFTEELSRFLLIWLGLLAASYAYRQRMHLALDLLVLKLKGKQRNVLNIIIHSLVALFSLLVLVYGGIQLVYLTWILDQHSPALGVSMSFVYLVLPVSGTAIVIYAIDFILKEAGIRENDDGSMIHPGRSGDVVQAE
jgi:TRAP-type C4-dicarboxylate transport system permease small subunit